MNEPRAPKADEWVDLGPADALRDPPLRQLRFGRTRIALSYQDGVFGAISGVCNHAAGPLGEGHCEGELVVCPWHQYRFHRVTGEGEPGYEDDRVPHYAVREQDGHLWLNLTAQSTRNKLPHDPDPLTRPVTRAPGPLRLLGISTTAMNAKYPRYSTSEALLDSALAQAASRGAETQLIRINGLRIRNCEGYYSKSAHACTWPCSITQMDKQDEMRQIYEALIFWCDAVIVSTPIRWGSASALYFKMVERMNCIQNQITLRNNVLIRHKVAGFIITGGQDNIQAVAGQMLMFFSELGFDFPQFPFIAHSRGWSHEDMENNMAYVKGSAELHEGARALADRALDKAAALLKDAPAVRTERGGRKAHREHEEVES